MILYLDCSSGASGDMIVSALLALAGATAKKQGPLDKVVRPALRAAGIDKRLVSLRDVTRGGEEALWFRVPDGPGFATFDELIMSMYASRLAQPVADGVAAVAQRMAAAEREVHGEYHGEHLDELGGLDTAVDLISAVALLHHLAPERIVACPPALGTGYVDIAHGMVPVPAPAVAALLRGIPTVSGADQEDEDKGRELGELTTPTGAALLAQFVEEYGPAPAGRVAAVGMGAGTREVPGRANVLRALFIVPAPEEETMDTDAEREATEGRADSGAVRRIASGLAAGVRRSPRDEQAPAPPAPEQRAGETVPRADDSAGPPVEEARPPEPVAAAYGAAPPAEEAQPPVEEVQPPVEEARPPEPVAAVYEAAPPAAEAVGATVAPAEGAGAAASPLGRSEQSEETKAMHEDDHGVLDHVVLEANIDDMSAELLAHAAEVLREAGALDVWLTQALMKKGRPGVVLHVLGTAAERQHLADLVFAETTTFGLRVVPVARVYAEERRETIRLAGHEIRVRISLVDGRPATVAPEFEDCRRAADQLGRPAKVVYEAAQAAARSRFSHS